MKTEIKNDAGSRLGISPRRRVILGVFAFLAMFGVVAYFNSVSVIKMAMTKIQAEEKFRKFISENGPCDLDCYLATGPQEDRLYFIQAKCQSKTDTILANIKTDGHRQHILFPLLKKYGKSTW